MRAIDPAREPLFRRILEEDTGREFHMVNLLKVHRELPSGLSGRDVLMKYQRPFIREMLRPIRPHLGFAREISTRDLGLKRPNER